MAFRGSWLLSYRLAYIMRALSSLLQGFNSVMKKNMKTLSAKNIDLKLLEYAINSSSCAITIADARTKDMPLIYINKTFEKITGYKKSEVLGKNCRFLQGKKRKQAGLKKIRDALKNHKPCTVTLENEKKDGTPFWNELHLAPVFDRDSKLTHYVGVQTNITERVHAERELERHQENLENLVRDRTGKLEEKNVALQEILSQIELEKKKIKDQIIENVDTIIMPLLEKMKQKLESKDQKYADFLQQNLEELTSTFGANVARKLYKLTPREIEVSNMIRSGLSTKDIAQFFNVSLSTVENQRNTIRKKLGISKREVNLTSYLQSLSSDLS